MIVNAKKNQQDDGFTLSFVDGGIETTLWLDKEELKTLKETIEKVLTGNTSTPRYIWNPRSGKHELVNQNENRG